MVKVKALEWKLEERQWWSACPPVMIGGCGYEVRVTDRGKTRIRLGSNPWHDFDGVSSEAKDVCQMDFVRRVQSALEEE